MELLIDFPGKARVDAHVGPYTIITDQPPQGGGDGSAPSPFAMFLSTIGTCAGIYVVGFCRQRNLPTENIRIIQRVHSNPMSGMVSRVELDIQLPPDFPEKYKDAVVRSANQCAVKKHFEHPPEITVEANIVEPA
jgi:ribosomal protein S12 methylthiotransferase accessory factor